MGRKTQNRVCVHVPSGKRSCEQYPGSSNTLRAAASSLCVCSSCSLCWLCLSLPLDLAHARMSLRIQFRSHLFLEAFLDHPFIYTCLVRGSLLCAPTGCLPSWH